MADSTPSPSTPSRPKKLLDQVRDAIRLKHYSRRTEESYVGWVKRFILYHGKRHPNDMGRPEIEAFLTCLATQERVAASTQNQALAALLFLYRNVLHRDDPALFDSLNMARAEKPAHLPTVLTKEEVTRIIQFVPDEYQLMARLLYGSGLRLMECVRLRVMAVRLPIQKPFQRPAKPAIKPAIPPPRPRERTAKGSGIRCASRRHSEARDVPHLPTLVRHAFAGSRL